ncbi:hypothetical protein Dda_7324 [Drechslerella dactyloides]|uniref:Alpha-ketoglutarate-dependent dioxygenase AlkB-like domain-containing protein n=1 Tax=Drechslerella dactyloides TaxID=74499 RepID=A0AAD6IT72_DREDA|nr:hypothetical protein Dda_7324 [Drechslerella dactyloides]
MADVRIATRSSRRLQAPDPQPLPPPLSKIDDLTGRTVTESEHRIPEPITTRARRTAVRTQTDQGLENAPKDTNSIPRNLGDPSLTTMESPRITRSTKRKADEAAAEVDPSETQPTTKTEKRKTDMFGELSPPDIPLPDIMSQIEMASAGRSFGGGTVAPPTPSRNNKFPFKKPKITARRNAKIPNGRTVGTGKPPATGKPEVWCDTRQELCETLPSFRSYQGGCYASKGFVRGYLIDGHASERDYIDASIIITHVGGNSEEVEGERRLVKNQVWDKGVIAHLRDNRDQRIPLVAIIGENCPTAPAKLVHRYSIMDWFKVTHCWPEVDGMSGKIRCKFRLEKLDSSQRGWWAAADTPGISASMAIENYTCPVCSQVSPYIYDGEPMCLNKDCTIFWIVTEHKPQGPPRHFVYRKSFLHGRTNWPELSLMPPAPLAPTLPVVNEMEFTGPPTPENRVDPSILTESFVLPDGRRAMVYELLHCGKVIHILANKSWNASLYGSDWLLDKYQAIEMPFKRHELKSHKCTGRLLTQQFSFNSGAPYKYIVEVESLPFDKSPAVVQQAMSILQADVSLMFPDALPMNEVLNVAYFEEQKMDFHDDGEDDLGPCISSISLGSPAMMSFRVKGKYCNERLSDADRMLLRPSNPTYSTGKEKRQTKRNILELRLHHGDVIIMNGRPIQRLLEHAVTPEGFRIAATARNISSYNAAVNSTEKLQSTMSRKPQATMANTTTDIWGQEKNGFFYYIQPFGSRTIGTRSSAPGRDADHPPTQQPGPQYTA